MQVVDDVAGTTHTYTMQWLLNQKVAITNQRDGMIAQAQKVLDDLQEAKKSELDEVQVLIDAYAAFSGISGVDGSSDEN